MDILPIEVEVVNEDSLNDNDRVGFVKTEAMQLGEEERVVGSKIVRRENEEQLIKHFMDGKLSFSDYKVFVLDPADEDDEEEDEVYYNEGDKDDPVIKTEAKPGPSSSRKFELELTTQRRDMLRGQFSKVATSTRGRGKKSILPPALQGLMGEANLKYARGDNATAERVCMEIIRQVPLAVEPFHTLAQIYEGSNPEKSMQFMFIAGHLNPSDVDHWIRLAELSEDLGNEKQAISCYTHAVKAAPHDIELRLRRIEALRKIGDDKAALKCQLLMIRYIKDPEYQMATAREVAQKYHEMGAPERALIAFHLAHMTNSDHFTPVEVNQYLELLIDNKLYNDALTVLCQHTQLDIDVRAKTARQPHSIEAVVFPPDMIPDLRTKAAICLVHLDCKHLYEHIVQDALQAFNVDDYGDCLLDIAEAFMAVQGYEFALQLLKLLIESEKFSLAAVFLRYADCLRLMGDIDQAVDSYRQVVQMAPQHLDARLTLSALLKQRNQHAEALQALEQDPESDVLEPTLLYEHCYMLKETGNIEQYIDLSGVLFSRHCFRFRNREEVEIGIMHHRTSLSRAALKEFREFRLEDLNETEGPEFAKAVEVEQQLDKDAEWQLFVDVVKQCYYTGRYATMQMYTHTAMTSKQFEKRRSEIRFMALIASMLNRDYTLSLVHAREMLLKNPGNRRAWNLFMAIQQVTSTLDPGTRANFNRFVGRLEKKEADHVEREASLWRASHSLSVGSYPAALRDFVNNFKETGAPFSALLTAIVLSHMAVQRHCTHKGDYVNQAVVYINEYAKAREPEAEQEVLYNTGRLYQQLGLMTHAVECYRKVLACESHPEEQVAELIDLRMEAAFNLHLIYKQAKNYTLARKYLNDYVVV